MQAVDVKGTVPELGQKQDQGLDLAAGGPDKAVACEGRGH